VRAAPPRSFPGKLLAVLLARYEAFCGAADKGLVIVPTELIPDNGTRLRGILRELAESQVPDVGFLHWLENANTVCNSLVDRIVPGKPDAAAHAALGQELGYEDELLTMSEVYALWAIEGDERVRQVLSFAPVHPGIIVQPDINQFKELKLRLLNGTHSLASGLAVLAGVPTVRAAMENEPLCTYIRHLMLADLLPGIPYPIDEKVGQRFGMQVLDRFRNPAVEHRWLAITLNYSAKLRMRVVPDLLHYYARCGAVPQYVALGFAGYLLFMRGTRQEAGNWYGEAHGQEYLIQDEQAGFFADLWAHCPAIALPREALSDLGLWGTDLTALPGFAEAVTRYLLQLEQQGAAATLAAKSTKAVRAAV
jgi:tagaturonate reductase